MSAAEWAHLGERLGRLRDRIAEAARSVGRDPSEVTLVAVSKTFPLEAVAAAYEFGQRDFGESRLQEALPKIEALPPDIRWHFIGPLQSNKARRVGETFHLIHTLCTESQLRELAKLTKPVEALIEVNIAEEPQKSGVAPSGLDGYRKLVLQCPTVRYRGLMTVGPALGDPEAMRPLFGRMREMGREHGAEVLSMGMSDDYAVAVTEGATHVRVGSALFGARG